ncbi:hypothetical protein [Thioalkalivibrio sp. HK1]|uniref:hypothetical protein n=1 Tax=Thioalkalivibrio sp. HK1 TaxID=1469245 RepID=UPI0012DFCF5A|nr:hypothetical protein [Thioalkalivibrio sp. HK1]
MVVGIGIAFQWSPLGDLTNDLLLDLHRSLMNRWWPAIDLPPAEGMRPLPGSISLCLVIIGALTWWESREPKWAIASSVVALVALGMIFVMMRPAGTLVPASGIGFAILAGSLGRLALEASIADKR